MTIMENKMKGKNNNNHNHSHPTINSHRGQLFVAQFLSRSQNPRALLLSRTADKACAWHCRFKGGLSNLMFGSIFHHFFSGFCVFLVFVPGFPGICSGIVGVLCVCVCVSDVSLAGPIMGLQWSTLMIPWDFLEDPQTTNTYSHIFPRDRFPKYIGN